MISINAIHTFIIIAKLGSFTKAARELDISAMAVSKQIKQLEYTLGVTLFERTTRKMALTEIGGLLFHQYSDILNSLDTVTQFICTQKKSLSGKLNIISTFSLGEFFLIPHLAEFLDIYPEITLNLNMVDIAPNLFDEKIDIAFGFSQDRMGLQSKDLRHTNLISFQRKLYASKIYLKKYGRPKNLKSCHQHNYIFNSKRIHDEFLDACKKYNIKLRSLITTNSINALIQGCQSGLGLVSLPEFIVSKMPDDQKLIEIDNLVKPTSVDAYLFYRNLRYIDPKIICFKNFFKEKLKLSVSTQDTT